jgi:RNase P/RNase MRP subunit POP5
MRIKSRFIIAQVLPSGATVEGDLRKLLLRDIHQALRDKIQELYGDVGSGEIGGSTMVKFFDVQHSGILVVRCPREKETEVQFALAALSKVKTTDLVFRSLRVKGSARTCIDTVQELVSEYVSFSVADEEAKQRVVDGLLQAISSIDL